jgi:plasmid stabilization system protein ParE
MAEVRWTPQAADDLDAIAEFISQDSPHYSNLFVLDVLCAVDRLKQSKGVRLIFLWLEVYTGACLVL